MKAHKNPWGIIEISDEELDKLKLDHRHGEDNENFATITIGDVQVGLVKKCCYMFISTKPEHKDHPKSILIDGPWQARLISYALLKLAD